MGVSKWWFHKFKFLSTFINWHSTARESFHFFSICLFVSPHTHRFPFHSIGYNLFVWLLFLLALKLPQFCLEETLQSDFWVLSIYYTAFEFFIGFSTRIYSKFFCHSLSHSIFCPSLITSNFLVTLLLTFHKENIWRSKSGLYVYSLL